MLGTGKMPLYDSLMSTMFVVLREILRKLFSTSLDYEQWDVGERQQVGH